PIDSRKTARPPGTTPLPERARYLSPQEIPPPGPGERDNLVAGVRWQSREAEGEGDPLLFVHGLLASSAMWKRVLASAGGGRPGIAVDLPGFGGSDRAG